MTPIVLEPIDGTDRPTLQEVALLLRTRTVGDTAGGLGGDTQSTEITTFTDDTRPTSDEVEQIITIAHPAVLSQVRAPSTLRPQGAIRHAVAIYAAILVESSFFRETDDDRLRDLLDRVIRGINDVTADGDSENRYGYGMVTIQSQTAPDLTEIEETA